MSKLDSLIAHGKLDHHFARKILTNPDSNVSPYNMIKISNIKGVTPKDIDVMDDMYKPYVIPKSKNSSSEQVKKSIFDDIEYQRVNTYALEHDNLSEKHIHDILDHPKLNFRIARGLMYNKNYNDEHFSKYLKNKTMHPSQEDIDISKDEYEYFKKVRGIMQ